MAKRKRPEIAGVGEKIFGVDQSAAVSELLPQVAGVTLEDIPVGIIDPNPYQPRDAVVHDNALDELAASIRERGILQPIRLRPHGERYQLIAGERRWRAAQLVEFETIPALVVDIDDASMRVEAIIENLQREDLNEMERAKALSELKEALGLTWDEVASKVGLSRRSIMRIVGLTTLPDSIQYMIANGQLSEKHGRALRKLNNDPKRQMELAQDVVNNDLTGDETVGLVKEARTGGSSMEEKRAMLINSAVATMDQDTARLNRLTAELRDIPLRKRDQQHLRGALKAFEGALRALRVLCEG